jgi:N-carbamoyl-L-amino-acid hydrolase
VRLWLDARAPDPARLDAWQAQLGVEARVAARSDGVAFPAQVRAAFGLPGEVLCFAGHDAGVLSEIVPAGMVLVRNATGVSHAPDEFVGMEDAAYGAAAILRAVEALA